MNKPIRDEAGPQLGRSGHAGKFGYIVVNKAHRKGSNCKLQSQYRWDFDFGTILKLFQQIQGIINSILNGHTCDVNHYSLLP